MATKEKNVGTHGKEKKGIHSSSSSQTHPISRNKTSPKPSRPSDALDHKDLPSSSSKQTPHYLKPTISSRLDPPHKKIDDKKPSFSKRPKPLDKPPSPLREQKPVTPPKPIGDRTAKTTPRVGKSQSSIGKPNNLNRCANTGSKKEIIYAPSSDPNRTESDPEESLVHVHVHVVEEQLVEDESEEKYPSNEILPVVSESKKQVDGVHDESPKDNVGLTLEAESVDTHFEETGDHLNGEVNGDIQQEEKEDSFTKQVVENTHAEEGETINPDVVAYENPKVVLQKNEEFAGIKDIAHVNGDEEKVSVKKLDEKEEVLKESEDEKVAVKQQVVHGKKDSPAYNDVIEQTASKLVEKRKSKVKALVGAFETVISLQEPDS